MTTKANAAILYRPEGYATGGARLMGRQAAGEGFLKGFARHAEVDALYCYTPRREHAEQFRESVKAAGNTRPIHWLNETDARTPASAGALYLPDPSLSRHAWRRRRYDQRAYSIVGITHTTASAGAMDWIANLVASPVQEWDALVCTSRVVKDTVEFVLEAQAEFLAARLGARNFPRPRLPIIPLGIDTDAMTPDGEARAAARIALGIGPGDMVFLFVGRLSFHAKAHPLPMYLGLERAARASGKRLHLIQAGWFANDFISDAFKSGARSFCPSVHCHFLDGRQPDARRQAWHAADIFTSLSDNIQETFGLAPVEAMAAGLPSVVTDWNGYRDTIRQEEDGIRVPTLMPPPGWAEDLADRYAANIDNYDHYCGFASQFVAVDPEACAAAYLRLIGDAGLRTRMGESARRRAVAEFDWRIVIGRYQQLWQELGERRKGAAESTPRSTGRPVRPDRADPFQAFASYATETLSPEHRVELAPGAKTETFETVTGTPLFAFAHAVTPTQSDITRIFQSLQGKNGKTVEELTADWPADARTPVARALIWLAKLGLVRISGKR